MNVVQVGDRHQVIDARGRYVRGFETAAEAQAFVVGYAQGRQDGRAEFDSTTAGLAGRIGGAA